MDAHVRNNKKELADELADVFYWVLLIAHDTDIDLKKAVSDKLAEVAKKYPVDRAYGKNKKYTEYNRDSRGS